MRLIVGTVLALLLILGVGVYKAKAEVVTPEIQRIVVKDDPGGRLDEYYTSLVNLKKAGLGVKLDGLCASACTMIVNTDLNINVCVTQNASLGIHHPFMMSSEGEIGYSIPAIVKSGQVWSEVFYKKYPDWLRKFIDDNNGAPDVYLGAAPSDMLRVPFNELSKHMAVCQ